MCRASLRGWPICRLGRADAPIASPRAAALILIKENRRLTVDVESRRTNMRHAATMAVADKVVSGSGRQGATRTIALNEVAFDAPWDWLACGWRDFWAAPVVSLSYGVL